MGFEHTPREMGDALIIDAQPAFQLFERVLIEQLELALGFAGIVLERLDETHLSQELV